MKQIQLLTWCFFAMIPPCFGQLSADQAWVESGRLLLEQKNLTDAHTHFTRALALNPDNPDANVLQAATSLLLLPQQGPGSSFLDRLGISKEGRNLYNWTAQAREDAHGDIVLPANFKSEEAINLYRNEVVPLLQSAQRNLARISDVHYTLQLKDTEVPSYSVTLDWGDIQVIRAMLYAGEFLGHTFNAHNFKGSVNRFFDLGKNDQLTAQRFLKEYPSFLKGGDSASLAASQNAFSNAVVQYVMASEFIRNPDRRPTGAQRLFTLESEDYNDEAHFRNAMIKILVSTQRPVKINEDDDYYIYARNYFSGAKPLRDLMPKFSGNYYLTNSLPSYTFGGVTPALSPAATEMFLRDRLGPIPYSGYYLSRGSGGPGTAALLVQPDSTGWKVTLAGVSTGNFGCLGCGIWGASHVNKDGTWSQTIPAKSEQSSPGRFSGRLEGDGIMHVRFQNPSSAGLSSGDVFEFEAKRMTDSGRFVDESGLYGGSVVLPDNRILRCLLLPDRNMYFNLTGPSTYDEGTISYLDQENHFFAAFGEPMVSVYVEGNLDREQKTMAIDWWQPFGESGQGVLSRVEYLPNTPILPTPTILTQPASVTATAGNSAAFSVKAAGTPPLTYQWWHNDEILPLETSPNLTLKPVQVSQAGHYRVVIANLGGLVVSEPAILTVLPESVPPIVKATTPFNSSRLLDPSAVIHGIASDNSQVRDVLFRLNGGPWVSAVGTVVWHASIQLEVGLNEFQCKAIDEFNNESTINTMSLFLVAADWIHIGTTGMGVIKPDYNGQRLELGKEYTLTATPAAGQVFSNWTGSISSSQPTLKFRMESNLVLQAHFVPNPYPAWKGTYNGLFTSSAMPVTPGSSRIGSFTLTVSDKGVASGKLIIAGKSLPFSGLSFDLSGHARTSVKRAAPLTPLGLELQVVSETESGQIRGQVTSEEGTSELLSFRQQAVGAWKGNYTFLANFNPVDSPSSPPGAGAGSLSLNTTGKIKLVGTLADGNPFTASVNFGHNGWFPVYVPLYSSKGLVWGWSHFEDPVTREVSGSLTWYKPVSSSPDQYYPDGFLVTGGLNGSAYNPPARGQSALNWTEGRLHLFAGNLSQPQMIPIRWSNNQLVVIGDNPLKCTATITPTSGLVQGSILHPDTGKKTPLKGAIVQRYGLGAGWFLGTNQGGAFQIRSNAVLQP
ncbi:MAG TPA: immunoglobulin domain-containing protein [Candidatus Paceibacterota bacterium]|nr:immunoglobulin domain-containing protein [Verrucomicrobiota bacterium]HRY48163.1 immunoglobulin domain-containing protein [Candidatus Paceibacterota bacterium]